jgi:hypothetical protein
MSLLISIIFPQQNTAAKYGSGMLLPSLNNAFGAKCDFLNNQYML